MSTVLSEVKCRQCGFSDAWEGYDCRSGEWRVDCPRCGYVEELRYESRFKNGHPERVVHKFFYSAGAYCGKDPKSGIEQHASVLEDKLEEAAARMREDIAAGRLSPESYVTQFNFATHEVTALVGQLPTAESPDLNSMKAGSSEVPVDAVDCL